MFYNAAKELMKWTEDVQAKMATARQPQSVVEAESLLEVHKELQVWIWTCFIGHTHTVIIFSQEQSFNLPVFQLGVPPYLGKVLITLKAVLTL